MEELGEILAALQAETTGEPQAPPATRPRPSTPPRPALYEEEHSQEEVKRRPGRPSKNPAQPTFARRGVVGRPMYSDSMLEMSWEKPEHFKKIFAYFDKLKCNEIMININSERVCFYAKGEGDDVLVQVCIAGKGVLYYYGSPAPFWLRLERSSVQKIFSMIDKSFSRIMMDYRLSDPRTFVFRLLNDSLGRENVFSVMASEAASSHEWESFAELVARRDERFKVSWMLPQKEIKRTHAFAQLNDQQVRVEMTYGSALKVVYRGSDIMPFTENYRKPKEIDLDSRLKENEFLNVVYPAAKAGMVSAALPIEYARVYCSSDLPVLFWAAERLESGEEYFSVATLLNQVKAG